LQRDNLLEELEPLVAWKRQMGIHTTVVPLSKIGSSESSAIYDFVKNYYAEHGITYLLLVGDEDAIEPQMRPSDGRFVLLRQLLSATCRATTISRNHGRAPARRPPEQMRIMVNRNLEYEKPLTDSAKTGGHRHGIRSNEGLGYWRRQPGRLAARQ
jgi:hypothetical protein